MNSESLPPKSKSPKREIAVAMKWPRFGKKQQRKLLNSHEQLDKLLAKKPAPSLALANWREAKWGYV